MVFGVLTIITFCPFYGVAVSSLVSCSVLKPTRVLANRSSLDHRHLKPKAIHDPEILEEFSKDYMYLQCIQFINSVSGHAGLPPTTTRI